jgi:hypothetical protein
MSKLIIKTKYSVIPNDLVNNLEISLKAKGLFAYIQSKPDGWDFSAERIAKYLKEGLQSVSSALKELEKSGYLIRQKKQNEWGHWEIEYVLNEIPAPENPAPGNPVYGNPTYGNPMPGKHPNNTKQLNTKQDYKEIVKTRRDEIFDLWFKYKAEKKQKYTESGKIALLKKWDYVTDDQLEDFINHSMANNYSGIFEKSLNNNNNGNSTGEKLGTSAARMAALAKF